ncbi:metal-dependent hydrolase [Paenibacillus sp. GD4]|uniref:metal-dependent hydrolase n=1 Tax=Paenibacillus sp. GD4 TaxID=3068890 RepID=UPI0027969280|nr:metal-dependent hydrolase [Paenibacillus sp. GD4]MDQ1909615.1 metal-dependent hydrolase [Paenibacillus sp. GD4]
MNILFHGHSCFQISDGEHSLLIDPFISGNSLAVTKPEEIKTEYILLTHGHPDHILDTVPIAKANDATVIATFELSTYMGWQGLKTRAVNIGGRLSLGFAELQMVQAFHSSGIIDEREQKIIYAGMPGGFLIHWNGKTILHTGDTSLFSDMKLIGERNAIDVAFIPIGDVFTMGPEDAAVAAEWLQAKCVVPMHYDTFPPIAQQPDRFVQLLSERGIEGKVLQPGQSLQL